MGEIEAAAARYQAALDVAQTFSADDPQLATTRATFGGFLTRHGELERGLGLIAEAEAAMTRTGSPRAAGFAGLRGEILANHGRCGEAIPLFERAIAAARARGGEEYNRLIFSTRLADCLWSTRFDRRRARRLMTEVRDAAQGRGEGGAKLAAQTADWLASHR